MTGSVWFFLLVGKHGNFYLILHVVSLGWLLIVVVVYRALVNGPDNEFNGISVYGAGGVVC